MAALTSVVSSFYYINLIKILFFEDTNPPVRAYYESKIGIPCLVGILFISIFAYLIAPEVLDSFFTTLVLQLSAPLVY